MQNVDLPIQLQNFLSGERVLEVPFDLTLGEVIYQCHRVLRLLPKRRLVLEASTVDGFRVVLKCFAKTKRAERDFNRELRGYSWVSESRLRTPSLLTVSKFRQINTLVYTYQVPDKNNIEHSTAKLFQFVASLHEHGFYQSDIHFDNVLFSNGESWLIDLASLKKLSPFKLIADLQSRRNLALLLAQYPLCERSAIFSQVQGYYETRKMSWDAKSQKNLHFELQRAWGKRKRHYLRKRLRNCTETTYHIDKHWQYAADRSFWQDWKPKNLQQIESLFDTATILKAGNSATVISTYISGLPIVIKRYNIKNWKHALTRFWRPSRAFHSWMNAHLLKFVGIKTPKPLAFIEKRHGWFRSTAYFICEHIEGIELLDYYQDKLPNTEERSQLTSLFMMLKNASISHGDMKAQNLLIDKTGQIWLIDLDAMREVITTFYSQKLLKEDIQRFLKNWSNLELMAIFEKDLYPILDRRYRSKS